MKRSKHQGTCELCGHRDASSAMSLHLEACAVAHDAKGAPQSLISLKFEAAGDPRYWIDVEVRANAKLKALDLVLRELWLECCGHLSAFRIGREELGQNSIVGDVLGTKGIEVIHEYDFGTTTVLKGRVLGKRQGSLGKAAVRLLARNDALDWVCVKCEKPATVVCSFCTNDRTVVLCPMHAKQHEQVHDEGYLPVVNSPRMGMCGYTG